MQTKNFILHHSERLPTFNDTMASRRRSKNDDDYNPLPPLRQKMPRRCKNIQPFYAMDIEFEDEDDHKQNHSTKKKRALDYPPSTKNRTVQGLESPNPRRKNQPADKMIQKTEDNKQEINNISSGVISWLIEMKVIRENSVMVIYRYGTNMEILAQGKVTKSDIYCNCCDTECSLSEFLSHIGYPGAERCYEKIYVGKPGVSLLTCLNEAWNRHSVPARSGYLHVERRPRVQDDYDDSCVICADGGQLVCCDNCISTYHSECVGIKTVPEDDWHCPYCHCKFCIHANSAEILQTCFQCLKKYHWSCTEMSKGAFRTFQPPNMSSFCSSKCIKVYQKLEATLGKSLHSPEGFSWTIVRRIDLDCPGQNFKSSSLKAYCNSTVVLAAKLMEESFRLIVDRQTRTNMIQSVVYNCGSNLTRTNFSRFYTAVLEHKSRVICAASLRIPSPEIAEIPFIATTELWRKQGLCKLLLSKIEPVLADMGVTRIIIPSSDEMVSIWQEKFDFDAIDEDTKREIKTLNTLMFPATTRLMKVISKRKTQVDLNLPPAEEV